MTSENKDGKKIINVALPKGRLGEKVYDIFEVSKRIGHKSVKTTQDTYGHLFDEVQKSIANDLDGMRRR